MTVRILSIDGGGIRGLISAVTLAALEKTAGRPAAGLFDLIAGTATGGIIAAALTHPTRPVSGADLVSFYENQGPKIFSRTFARRLSSFFSLADEKYSDRNLNRILQSQLTSDAWLSQIAGNPAGGPELLVTAYDIEARTPFFFKSWRARGERWDCDNPAEDTETRDIRLWQMARAAVAAPTYFEPFRVETRQSKKLPLIDGGVYANNPAMAAYVAARRIFHCGEDVLCVSLGTGEDRQPIRYDDARNWGLIEWSRPIFKVLLGGSSDVVDYQLWELLGKNYLRVTRTFDDVAALRLGAIDDVSQSNIRALRRFAEEAATVQHAAIASMAARLAAVNRPRAGAA